MTEQPHALIETLSQEIDRLSDFSDKTVNEVLDQVYFMNSALWKELQALMKVRVYIEELQQADAIAELPEPIRHKLDESARLLELLRELLEVGKQYNHRIHEFLYP